MRKTVKMLHTGPSVACLHTDKYLKRREGGEKNSTDGITDVERSTAVRTSAVHLWTDAGPKRCATAGLSAGLQRLLEELDCKKYIREEFLRPRGAVSSNPRLAFRTDSFFSVTHNVLLSQAMHPMQIGRRRWKRSFGNGTTAARLHASGTLGVNFGAGFNEADARFLPSLDGIFRRIIHHQSIQ